MFFEYERKSGRVFSFIACFLLFLVSPSPVVLGQTSAEHSADLPEIGRYSQARSSSEAASAKEFLKREVIRNESEVQGMKDRLEELDGELGQAKFENGVYFLKAIPAKMADTVALVMGLQLILKRRTIFEDVAKNSLWKRLLIFLGGVVVGGASGAYSESIEREYRITAENMSLLREARAGLKEAIQEREKFLARTKKGDAAGASALVKAQLALEESEINKINDQVSLLRDEISEARGKVSVSLSFTPTLAAQLLGLGIAVSALWKPTLWSEQGWKRALVFAGGTSLSAAADTYGATKAPAFEISTPESTELLERMEHLQRELDRRRDFVRRARALFEE